MTAFAKVSDLEATLGRTFVGDDETQAEKLLEAASDHLRHVVGQDIYPTTTTTYKAFPQFGREDLPQWPVVSVDAVERDGQKIPYRERPGFIYVNGDGPVDITFTWGYAEPPAELARVTCVLAAQALNMLETVGALTAGGLSSVGLDDFRASFADGGAQTGVSLPSHVERSLKRAFGRGGIEMVETAW